MSAAVWVSLQTSSFLNRDQIFKDLITPAAANDRLIHHGIIVEFGKEISCHISHRTHRQKQACSGNAPIDTFFLPYLSRVFLIVADRAPLPHLPKAVFCMQARKIYYSLMKTRIRRLFHHPLGCPKYHRNRISLLKLPVL